MSNSLYVPIELDVLMANSAVTGGEDFMWREFSYSALGTDTFDSPESMSVEQNAPGTSSSSNGAYLHWTLPRSLRSSAEGDTNNYPLVPNRWLVVRRYQDGGNNAQKAWVLQSDCPVSSTDNPSAPFMVDSAQVTNWEASKDPGRNKTNAYVNYASQYQIAQAGYNGKGKTDAYTFNIGTQAPLAGWAEPTSATDKMFLTAVAPGNLAFSGYLPYCQGVFSFFDDLTGVAKGSPVSYFVTGWYSNPANDIITTGAEGFTGKKTAAEVLTALEWTVAADPTTGKAPKITGLDRSIYSGSCLEMQWDGNVPASGKDELVAVKAVKVDVSIGNTDIDAFTSLINEQINGPSAKYETALNMLKAFQYDLLEEMDKVNGDALLDKKVRGKWFQSKYGGTEWTITADPGVTITHDETNWLLKLNNDQKMLDEALHSLFDHQWEMNANWWRYQVYQNMKSNGNSGNLVSDYETALENEFKQSQAGSTTANLVSQFNIVNTQLGNVPQAGTDNTKTAQENFRSGIADFVATKGLGAGKTLKPVNKPSFWTPNNPHLMVSGVKMPAASNPGMELTVRLDSQVVSQYSIDGKTISAAVLGAVIPALGAGEVAMSGKAPVTTHLEALYNEFCMLDPANETMITKTISGINTNDLNSLLSTYAPATDFTGVPPSCPTPGGTIGANIWEQTWEPLYMEWSLNYLQIPFETEGNWTFDGTDYNLTSTGAGSLSGVTDSKQIQGKALLSPHVQFTLGGKLKTFLDQYSGTETELQDLYKEIEKTVGWNYLGQDLGYLNDYFTQRDPRPFRRPTNEALTLTAGNQAFANLVGFQGNNAAAPYVTPSHVQGLVNSVPAVNPDGSVSNYDFHGIRSSMIYLSKLRIYDKFGRSLVLINEDGNDSLTDPANFPLVRDVPMKPQNSANMEDTKGTSVKAPFQVPPRMLQPARLDMTMVDQKDNTKVLNLDADVNPVCGWVIPNHLDQSLLLFSPTGANMGELRLTVPTSDTATVTWSPPINSKVTSVSGHITPDYPELGAFITGAVGKTVAEFQILMAAIDSTLQTTAPLGRRTDQNLSVLIGRPLALLRTQLQFVLDGAALTPTEWPLASDNPKSPDFTSADFYIRMGDLATRQDGVIGYFTGTDYSVFNSVAAPVDTSAYVKEIGPLNKTDGAGNYLKMPFDNTTTQLITLLVDPRASIHATTGILPVAELQIPQEFVDPVLSKISLYFRTGPLLTRIIPEPDKTGELALEEKGAPPTLSYLPISEKHGKWSWWEEAVKNPGTNNATVTWKSYELRKADTKAVIRQSSASIREGYLRFDTDLE